MAHPPNMYSDLSMEDLIEILVMNANSRQQEQSSNSADSNTFGTGSSTRITTAANNKHNNKVIKLDFKEQETIEPTLKALVHAQQLPTTTIFLNADILPGPGRREPGVVTIDAAYFLETCQNYIQQHHQQQHHQQPQQSASHKSTSTTTRFAFSLGFKTMFSDVVGYTTDDVNAMTLLIDHYDLFQQKTSDSGSGGEVVDVVLALNARLLEKKVTQFDSMLAKYPKLQLLVWTGKGEPPIPQSIRQSIQDHFETTGMTQRIGYDCQVRDMGLNGTGLNNDV
jgi:Uncharacterized conserved protein (DUF2181)